MEVVRIPGKAATRSQLTFANGFAFTVATTRVASQSLYEQTRSALAAIEEQLVKVGLAKTDLVSATVYITDMRDKPEMNRAWDEWCPSGNAPTRVCVGVALEGSDLVEVAVVARRRESDDGPR